MGSIFTIRKIDLSLKAHYTHLHYSSGFYGEEKKLNRECRKKYKLKILSVLKSTFISKSLDSRLDIPVLMAQLSRSCISRLILESILHRYEKK